MKKYLEIKKILIKYNTVLFTRVKNAYSIIPTGFYNMQFWHEQLLIC